MSGMAVAKAEGGGLTWTAPPQWQSKPASGMRKATFVMGEGSELAVTAFPGDVGGELANVNRWRGQLQVAPISEAELAGALTRLESGGLRIAVADIAGGTPNKPVRMLGAMVPSDGATWFFKLTGPDAVVAKAKPAFLAFLQTLQATAAAPAAGSAPAMPAGLSIGRHGQHPGEQGRGARPAVDRPGALGEPAGRRDAQGNLRRAR